MIKSKIIGWNFRKGANRRYNADGSSSLEVLKSEKDRLEKRYVEIPKQIAQVNHSIEILKKDRAWLSSLSNRQKRKWEEEHGANVDQTLRTMSAKISELNARANSLAEERKRIPQQLESIQKQLNALISGEATGLGQGLDAESAQELGELALESERDKMEHERALREAELEQQRLEAEREKQRLETDQKQGSKQTQVWVILGIVALLGIVAYIIYKKKFATQIQTT